MSGDSTDSPVACRNCGWQVERSYCPNCGQHIGNHNNRLWPLIQEFLEEFVRFDSKLLRTLLPLVRHPGLLTRQWSEGKRASYISPLKLYVTLNAVFFLELSLRGNPQFPIGTPTDHPAGHHMTDSPDRWSFALQVGDLSNIDKRSLFEHFFMHLPAASLVLVPLTALILSVLYARRNVNYVEHLVFILHYNSFCFLSLGLAVLTKSVWLSGVAFLWALGYLLVALKTNYGQSWARSGVKYILFIVAYVPLLLLGFAGTAVVAASMAQRIATTSMTPHEMAHFHE